MMNKELMEDLRLSPSPTICLEEETSQPAIINTVTASLNKYDCHLI